MAAKIVWKLKDGAVAVISVGVEIPDGTPAQAIRERDLTNWLGGGLTSLLKRMIDGELVEVHADHGEGR